MSYADLSVQVLEEFAEASRLGRTNHVVRAAEWADRTWWRTTFGTTFVEPLPLSRARCTDCGGVVETRTGTKITFHVGASGPHCLARRSSSRSSRRVSSRSSRRVPSRPDVCMICRRPVDVILATGRTMHRGGRCRGLS